MTACLPYVLMALLVESLHGVQPTGVAAGVRSEQVLVLGDGPIGTSVAAYTCPACDWLRVDTRQVQSTCLVAAVADVTAFVAPPLADWPERSTPRCTAFRGPPSLR